MKNSPDILFEFKRIGTITKVTAIDAKTGLEVSIQGPTKVGRAELQNVAVKKLGYVLTKKDTKS